MLFSYVILLRPSVVPEVLEVHVIPSDEVRMVPEPPSATNKLLSYVNPFRISVVPEVLSVKLVPSVEVRMVPELSTVTNVLFP